MQRLLDTDVKLFRPGRNIGIVVIAPTRELVIQICQQATILATYHRAWTVQAFYGGGSIQRDRAILYHRPIPTILVATPGRLYDLLRESSRVQGNRNFADVIGESRIVVLDEADRLLQGFAIEMNKLFTYFPRVDKRQTMLFSATFSKHLKENLLSGASGGNVLPADFVTVDVSNDGDAKTQASTRVEESFVQLDDMKLYVPGLLSIVQKVMTDESNPKCKVIIFLPTAKIVKFFSEALTFLSVPVLSIHSRMSQGSRNRASTQFQQSTNRCVLLSSDVSARGVDYPDVSLVVQV
jgi:ATP-dependent RNA helicase MSS116, mitochondrial